MVCEDIKWGDKGSGDLRHEQEWPLVSITDIVLLAMKVASDKALGQGGGGWQSYILVSQRETGGKVGQSGRQSFYEATEC